MIPKRKRSFKHCRVTFYSREKHWQENEGTWKRTETKILNKAKLKWTKKGKTASGKVFKPPKKVQKLVASHHILFKIAEWAYLVAPWWRILLPVQETWVQFLIRENSKRQGATKPIYHNYWASALEPENGSYLKLGRPRASFSATWEATRMRRLSAATRE